MKNELLRRLSILEEKKVPQVNARLMRGGMQERLHRQEVIRFKDNVRKGKVKIKSKLAAIAEQEKLDIVKDMQDEEAQAIMSTRQYDIWALEERNKEMKNG